MTTPLPEMHTLSIFFVEDDAAVRGSLVQTLELACLHVKAFASAEHALAELAVTSPSIVISDMRLPGMDGLTLMEEVFKRDAHTPFILMTAHGDIGLAVRAMQKGAYDFLEKPFSPEHLVAVAQRAIDRRTLQIQVQSLRQQLNEVNALEGQLLGRSAGMQQLRLQVKTLASTAADVLLVGETGAGKERVARCLHDFSARRHQNFVAINCAGLPESLLESELFGHEAGAFTGASKRRIGKLEHAHGGTLLLDEIESMPMSFQAKLLRVLQERKIERLGSNAQISIDIRIVAASKVDLLELSRQEKFRLDLYYRLNVAVLRVPALRERREDIPLLLEHLIAHAAHRHGLAVPDTTRFPMHRLLGHNWPGNVRELGNVAERFVLGLPDEHLLVHGLDKQLSLTDQMEGIEKMILTQVLREHGGNASDAGLTLGLPKKTLYDKIGRHGIALDAFRSVSGNGNQK